MTVDLSNCDLEPIHIPGSIQPHGAMLVCDPATKIVIYASQTAEDLLGRRNTSLVGLSLAEVLGAEAAHDLSNAATKAGGPHLAGVSLGLALPNVDVPVDAVIHSHRNRIFVEIEPSSIDANAATQALDMTQTLVRRIGLESDVNRIAETGAKLIRAILGYDRVMIYRFLHNGAGRVIAEAKSSHLSSFMGQHFPASDIPFQARRLYLTNTIRMIGDVNFAPVPLEPPLEQGDEPVDMSYAQLRSVSPIHCEYLSNMGVAASMSISIVVDGDLWGLISCHHDTPKIVPMPLRVGAELFGQYFSMQIALAERRAALVAATDARERLDHIVSDIEPGEPVEGAVARHLAELSDLIASDGAGIWVGSTWNRVGRTPRPQDVETLVETVQKMADGGVWSTSDIRAMPGIDAGADFGSSVAGLLAIPISAVSRDYLLFFRSEEAFEVEWAGEPVKQFVSGPSGDRLSPRGSFDTWREDVRGKSRPWSDAEITVADTIRTYLRDVVLRYNEATADERERAERRRRILNDELNHRVKNILALVKSIARQTGATAASVEDYAASMEGRLRALAFAHDQSLQLGNGGDLEILIEAEASLHRYGAAADRVTIEGPPVGLTDRTFGVLALVVHELMTNAAKYGALSVPEGRLEITWVMAEDGACCLTWTETGGPVVSAPKTSGFGSKLIQSSIGYDLGGIATLDYAPAGLKANLVIPARHVVEAAAAPRSDRAPASTKAAALTGLDILVVEDQVLIAMDVEETLLALGAGSVRLAAGTGQAMTELGVRLPDCAVLDFNLGEETSVEIADALRASSVPFIFATGYGDSVMIPERFRTVPVVRKPVSSGLLSDKLESARSHTG